MSDASDISGVIAKALLAIISVCWGVVVLVHAYGLTIVSWPWLIFGTLGTFTLLAASGAWSKK